MQRVVPCRRCPARVLGHAEGRTCHSLEEALMRIVAVQTGLQADSVLGGETTDREVLTRLADRGIEIHVLAAEDREIMQHANLVPHYYKRRFYKRVPYRRNPNVTIALRSLLADLDRVDGVRFNSPYGAAL